MKTRDRTLIALMAATAFLACSEDEPTPVVEVNEAPAITLTSPAASAAYLPGSVVTIEWVATDDNGVVGVDLTYTADGGAPVAIASDLVGASYDWTVPNAATYGILIQATARDAEGLTATDQTTELAAVVAFSDRGYVTSAICTDCHDDKGDDLFDSGHPYKLNRVVNAMAPTYPFSTVPNPPTGFAWDDITYVIGGYGWKARFLDQDGFILVSGVEGVPTQYNLERTDLGVGTEWVNYQSGDQVPKPYTCGVCHTTGWQTLAENGGINQDGLPGIYGTWEEPGITCEACHGPGVDHVAAQEAALISVDTDKELCGSCHYRDTNHGILAKGGFIKHHEQYDELIAAGHNDRSCTDCHDPHIGILYDNAAAGGITVTCESCHSDKTTNSHVTNIDCVTCHMPRASKSARAIHSFQGDVQTHIFRINANAVGKADMFYEDDGNTFSRPFVTLDFACYSCHEDPLTGDGGTRSARTLAELSARATNIHN